MLGLQTVLRPRGMASPASRESGSGRWRGEACPEESGRSCGPIASQKYLVIACKLGVVHRHECSTKGAAMAVRVYRERGWAVDVLKEVGS